MYALRKREIRSAIKLHERSLRRVSRNFLANHSSLNYLCPSFACTRHALILLSRFHWLKVSIWVRGCMWVIYGHSESSRSISWISCICSRSGITFLRDSESSWNESRKGKHQIGNNYLSDALIDTEHARRSRWIISFRFPVPIPEISGYAIVLYAQSCV